MQVIYTIFFILLFSLSTLWVDTVHAQLRFGYGATLKTELFSNYKNPDDGIAETSDAAQSILLGIGVGPKVWVGGENFSVSPEAAVVYSPVAFNITEYKGLGAVSFPMMVKFHFLGMSNFHDNGNFGFALGAGIQYTRTELYGLKSSFVDIGVERSMFKTYVLEGDFGFGVSGFNLHGLIRYGFNPDTDASTISIGIGYDFNVPVMKESMDPEF